jgi:hypothetical protein
MNNFVYPVLVAKFGSALSVVAWQVHAQVNRVHFPNLDELVHYTTVRRRNVTEHITTTPAALDAVKNGNAIPAGTQFVLVDHRDEELYRYFVMGMDDEAVEPAIGSFNGSSRTGQ